MRRLTAGVPAVVWWLIAAGVALSALGAVLVYGSQYDIVASGLILNALVDGNPFDAYGQVPDRVVPT